MFLSAVIVVVIVVLVSVSNNQCNAEVDTYKVGGIFDAMNLVQQSASKRAFEAAINAVNELHLGFKFEQVTRTIEYDNPYEAKMATCELLEQEVIGIFGPLSEENSNVIQSICDVKEIPHIEMRWDDHPLNGTVVNVHPHPDMLTRTYIDLIEAWCWKDFVILYENNESLQRVGELLKFFVPSKHRIVVRQLTLVDDSYISVLKDLWRSGAKYFVLDCSIDVLRDVLRQAQQVGLMTNEQHYIITNLDLHTLDLAPYGYSETNITGMIFVDPDDRKLLEVAGQIHTEIDMSVAGWKLTLEEALTYDAVLMFAKAIKKLGPRINPINSMSCGDSEEFFSSGTSIINFMKTLQYEGLTGILRFDITGFRTHFGLDITELKEGGIITVGNWDSNYTPSLKMFRSLPPVENIQEDISNMTFIVITTLTEPYGMRKATSNNVQGNDRYEGFAIDLIHELSLMKGFNYTIIIREDKNNGVCTSETDCSGMLGDLISYKADLAITDLTITQERQMAVDFTNPFMTLGISILYKKPTKAPPSFFSFAQPFDLEVWKLLVVSCAGVSILLFVLGRISPDEWENPYPCIEEPEYLVNQLDLRNSFWFMTGAILQQGSEIELKSLSTRMVAGMWWFFTLLMVASYTANLAAFLTTESPDPHFSNFEELVQRAETKKIKYGAKKNGATANFFKNKALQNASSYYVTAWEFMERYGDEVLVSGNKEGVEKAEEGNYAFFMESVSIEYETERKCTLNMVNGLLDEKGYGIAMRRNSTYRNSLNTGILQMQSSGRIQELKTKWWEEKRGGGKCEGLAEPEVSELGLKNVEGVFLVTIYGTVLAVFLAMFETVLYAIKASARSGTTFKEAIIEEIKFYFKFREMVKPVIYSDPSEESSSHKFQLVEKELPYDLVSKLPSVETLESNSNSIKSKKSKKRERLYKKEKSVNTC